MTQFKHDRFRENVFGLFMHLIIQTHVLFTSDGNYNKGWSNGSFQVLVLFQISICCCGWLLRHQKQRHPAVSRAHHDCTTGTATVNFSPVWITLSVIFFFFWTCVAFCVTEMIRSGTYSFASLDWRERTNSTVWIYSALIILKLIQLYLILQHQATHSP